MKIFFAIVVSSLLFINLSCTTDQINQGIEILSSPELSGDGTPTSGTVASGLKQALDKGAGVASKQLSAQNGFFKNNAIKILFPPEFKSAEKKLRAMGLGSLADQVVTSFNRAAEKASTKAYPILASAITQMTITDAMNILMGPEDSATQYLKKTTPSQLGGAFFPVVKKSADSVNATKYWNELATTYNRIPFVKPVPGDINQYITERTVNGLFFVIKDKEKDIRENPVERTTDLLKTVFGYADKRK